MICIYTCLHAFANLSGVFSPLSLKYLYISFFSFSPCSLPAAVLLSVPLLRSSSLPAVCPLSLCPRLARPEAIWRPSVCRAVCRLVAAVTRPPSGAKRYDSGGRCSAYMSPALSPLAYVLPCVPWLVPWLPCVCPAAVCRLVVVIGGTPLYPGRRRCGAASVM